MSVVNWLKILIILHMMNQHLMFCLHIIDVIAGSSGSPIFKGNSMNITGIHSAGIHEDNMDYNIACRVSKYLVNDWERLYNEWN